MSRSSGDNREGTKRGSGRITSTWHCVDHLLENRETCVFESLLGSSHSFDSGVGIRFKKTLVRLEKSIVCGDQRTTCLSLAIEISLEAQVVEYKGSVVERVESTFSISCFVSTTKFTKMLHLPDDSLTGNFGALALKS